MALYGNNKGKEMRDNRSNMSIGKSVMDFIANSDLVKIDFWCNSAENKLNRFLELWSLPRKINAIKAESPIVIFTDDYKKTMREIEACKNRHQISNNIKTKKARVVIDDDIKIGVYIYLENENA